MTREVNDNQDETMKVETKKNPFSHAYRGLSISLSFGWCGFGFSGWREFRSIDINLGIVSLTIALSNLKKATDILFGVADMVLEMGLHYRAMFGGLTMYSIITNKLLRSAAEDDKQEFIRKANILLPYAHEAFSYTVDKPVPMGDEDDIIEFRDRWLGETNGMFIPNGTDMSRTSLSKLALLDLEAICTSVERAAEHAPAKIRKKASRFRKPGPDEGMAAIRLTQTPAAAKRKRAQRAAKKVDEAAGQ